MHFNRVLDAECIVRSGASVEILAGYADRNTVFKIRERSCLGQMNYCFVMKQGIK